MALQSCALGMSSVRRLFGLFLIFDFYGVFQITSLPHIIQIMPNTVKSFSLIHFSVFRGAVLVPRIEIHFPGLPCYVYDNHPRSFFELFVAMSLY